jgi:hypothetical protein
MLRKLLALLAVMLIGLGNAYAQEAGYGAGRVEIGAFPGGGIVFTESSKGNEPAFGNYALGASLTVNLNRWIGLEGEGGGTIGIHQSFNFNQTTFTNQRTPSMWAYSGNVVFNPGGSDRAMVPYASGGIGGLTLCPCGSVDNLGVTTYETYLTGNVGGGLKWFSSRQTATGTGSRVD